MTVQEITPAVDTDALLAGAQFADAFRVEIGDPALDARHAAERMMARQPRWAEALLSLRNLLVTTVRAQDIRGKPDGAQGYDRNLSGCERNTGSPDRGLQ